MQEHVQQKAAPSPAEASPQQQEHGWQRSHSDWQPDLEPTQEKTDFHSSLRNRIGEAIQRAENECVQRFPVDGFSRFHPYTLVQPPIQRVTMTQLREQLSPELMEVFRYWIRWAVKNTEREYRDVSADGRQRYRDAAELLEDRSLQEIRESLEVWSRGANFEHLGREESELDRPTEQTLAREPDPDQLRGNSVDGLTQREHLEQARKVIDGSGVMLRRISPTEAALFEDEQTSSDIDRLRPKGLLNSNAFPVERSIAFSLDSTHQFGDAARNRDASAYAKMLVIQLSPDLKRYLIDWLWNTNQRGGYGSNPQFKSEHRKYNIIIPPSGWSAFWRIAIATARVVDAD